MLELLLAILLLQGFGYGGGGDSGADLANGAIGFILFLGGLIVIIIAIAFWYDRNNQNDDDWKKDAGLE
jgi:hypothetical protein